MHAARIFLGCLAVLAALFIAGESRRVLDPRDPIAVDGSLAAGRALTITDQEPPAPPADLDDPTIFERLFSNSSIEQSRDAVLEFVELPGSAICAPDRREQLIAAIQAYKGHRKYLSTEFHFRGPRAGKFIDQAWMSEKDRKIEAFVARLLDQGYLRAREIPQHRSQLSDALVRLFGANPCARS